MIEMSDECAPPFKVGVEKNGEKVVVLKRAAKRAGINGQATVTSTAKRSAPRSLDRFTASLYCIGP